MFGVGEVRIGRHRRRWYRVRLFVGYFTFNGSHVTEALIEGIKGTTQDSITLVSREVSSAAENCRAWLAAAEWEFRRIHKTESQMSEMTKKRTLNDVIYIYVSHARVDWWTFRSRMIYRLGPVARSRYNSMPLRRKVNEIARKKLFESFLEHTYEYCVTCDDRDERRGTWKLSGEGGRE